MGSWPDSPHCESLATRDYPSTWPLSPTRLGIWPWHLGLSNEYTLGHWAFLLLPDTNLLPQAGITHYSQLLTWQHSTKLFLVGFFLNWSKLIFKVLTTTWGVPPGYILTNLIINWLLDGNANRKWEKSPSIRTVNNWWLPNLLFANRLRRVWLPWLQTSWRDSGLFAKDNQKKLPRSSLMMHLWRGHTCMYIKEHAMITIILHIIL